MECMKTNLWNNKYYIDINFKVNLYYHIKKNIRFLLCGVLKNINTSKFYIYINIVDNTHIIQLNEKWKKLFYATNILTFQFHEASNNSYQQDIIGDITISLEKAYYYSNLIGINIHEELSILVVHGLLHLLGFNHDKNFYENIFQKTYELKVLGYLNNMQYNFLYYRTYIIYI